MLIKLCWLNGDASIKKDHNLLAEVALAAANLIDLRIAEVKKKLEEPLFGNGAGDVLFQYNALLRFYFNIEPPTNWDEWIYKVHQLRFALEFDGKFRSTHGDIILP